MLPSMADNTKRRITDTFCCVTTTLKYKDLKQQPFIYLMTKSGSNLYWNILANLSQTCLIFIGLTHAFVVSCQVAGCWLSLFAWSLNLQQSGHIHMAALQEKERKYTSPLENQAYITSASFNLPKQVTNPGQVQRKRNKFHHLMGRVTKLEVWAYREPWLPLHFIYCIASDL